jgi:hypothetical protein
MNNPMVWCRGDSQYRLRPEGETGRVILEYNRYGLLGYGKEEGWKDRLFIDAHAAMAWVKENL